MTYLTHVTISTAHTTRQQRDADDDDAIAEMSSLLDGALMGGRPPIPGHAGYYLSATSASAHVLVATIWIDPPHSLPVITTGVALKSRSAPKLWRMLHDITPSPVATNRDRPPPAPWIADVAFPVPDDQISVYRWTGAITRLIGLAWLEYNQ